MRNILKESDTRISGHPISFIDIDETTMHTFAKVNVVKNGKIIKSLDNKEFNTHKLGDGETYNFDNFKDAKFFNQTSQPIEKTINRIKNVIQSIKDNKKQEKVIFLTARSDFDDKEIFLDTFRKFGIDVDIPNVHVERSGNLTNIKNVADRKKYIILKYLKSGLYTAAKMYDDDKKNLQTFEELGEEVNSGKYGILKNIKSNFPRINKVNFYPLLVNSNGKIETFESKQPSNDDFDDNLICEVTGYHGSAYDFDKFDVAFVGKGEHGQAHGWGLYFSFGESIAQGYRERISSINRGEQFQAYTYKGKSYAYGTVMYNLLEMLVLNGKKEAISKLDRVLKDDKYISTHEGVKEYLEKVKKQFEKIKDGDLRAKPKYEEGNFYTVKLPELKYYLDEDSSYNNQSDFVKKCLRKLYRENKNLSSIKSYMENSSFRGGGFLSALERDLGHKPKDASLLLNKYGIVGIKYEGSRDENCAVIFNNNDIKILSKATVVNKDEPLLPEEMAIESNPELIANYENPSEKIQKIAVTNMPKVIRYIKNPTQEVINIALDLEPSNIAYINNLSIDLIKKYIDKLSVYTIRDILKNQSIDDSIKEYICIDEIKRDVDFLYLYLNKGDPDIKTLNKMIKIIKENNVNNEYKEKLRHSLSNISAPQKDDVIKLLQDAFYNSLPYINLDDKDLSMNYSLTSLCDNINTASKEVREKVLSWRWRDYIYELSEFTNDDLNVFKMNYKLGYLYRGDNWTYFSLSKDCIIKENVLKDLIDFITEIKKNDNINVEINDLYRYMELDELYKIINSNEEKVKDIFGSLYNNTGKVKKEDLFLYIIKNKIKNIKDVNSRFGSYLINYCNDILNSLLVKESNVIDNNDILQIMIINLYIKRGYNFSKYFRNMLKNASSNVQKYIFMKNIELMKFVNKVDLDIQNKIININPYYIKYINNPSKSVIKKATNINPDIIDYIRN